MAFTDFVCLFGKEGEAGRARDGDRLAAPRSYTKTLRAGAHAPARSRLVKTQS